MGYGVYVHAHECVRKFEAPGALYLVHDDCKVERIQRKRVAAK